MSYSSRCTQIWGNVLLQQRCQKVSAWAGENIVLPCKIPPTEDISVEWSKKGLKPNVDLVMKNDDYRGRTFLLREDLRRGNMSLKLVNVGLSDAGTYRCFVPKLQGNRKETVVQLIVGKSRKLSLAGTEEKGTPAPSFTEELPRFVCGLLALSLVNTVTSNNKQELQIP
uniref:Ig-like domain-containing protein n=1 Tax=Myripristis murdjan TaxID=586833 RepID=A0A667ZDW4_9TELE